MEEKLKKRNQKHSRKRKSQNDIETEETIIERKRKVRGYSCELKDDLKMIIKKNETEHWRTTKKLESLLGGGTVSRIPQKSTQKIMNAKYPVTMRNRIVYRNSRDEILSLTILENRWKLFAHTLP